MERNNIMSKKTAIAAAVAALMFTAGAAQAAQVAINGGFETGTFNDGTPNASWQEFPNNGVLSVTTDNPASGTYAANLLVPTRTQLDPAVDALIKNANLAAGLLTPGADVTVTWDMRGSLEGAGGVIFVELFSELAGGGTSKSQIYTDGPLAPDADWQSFVWNTTLGPDVSGGVTLQLKASCGPVEGCGVDAYFDNITITTDVSAVPVPAAAWLFGSALLGLGGLARRKKAA
jgi:hypothetical protein